MPPILAIVVPCYNEEDVLPETSRQLLLKVMDLISSGSISTDSKIIFVDDGSQDKTWRMIEEYYNNSPRHIGGIKLSNNRGHQNALLCGLLYAKDFAEITVSIDADLQDDIAAIDEMIVNYKEGFEIVFGVRANRKKDSFLKRTTAQGFYTSMRLLGADIIYNHADFRLMSKKALDALEEYGERNLFLRGIVPSLGYKTSIVYYDRKERFAGTSKYPLKKMLRFALEGITSFSIRPIRLITVIGLLIFTVSLVMIIYTFIQFAYNNTVSGWSSIICSIWGIGGLLLLGLGVVGEYIGKIYMETKRRPRYIIEKTLIKEG